MLHEFISLDINNNKRIYDKQHIMCCNSDILSNWYLTCRSFDEDFDLFLASDMAMCNCVWLKLLFCLPLFHLRLCITSATNKI
jgi:hypothetical protein